MTTTRRSFILGALSTALWVPTRSFHDIGRSYSIAEELAAIPNPIWLKDVKTRMLVGGVWVEIETQPEPESIGLAESRDLPDDGINERAEETRAAAFRSRLREWFEANKGRATTVQTPWKPDVRDWARQYQQEPCVPLTIDDIRQAAADMHAHRVPMHPDGNYHIYPSPEAQALLEPPVITEGSNPGTISVSAGSVRWPDGIRWFDGVPQMPVDKIREEEVVCLSIDKDGVVSSA